MKKHNGTLRSSGAMLPLNAKRAAEIAAAFASEGGMCTCTWGNRPGSFRMVIVKPGENCPHHGGSA